MMKLIACHIENFGNLCGVDYKFDGNLTQFCEDNGYGKTTLAAFIKAMFYGLPSVRANTREFNDRKHFYPFNGGKFGGSLTFETGEKTYKIERFFAKKSDTDDETTLYCNNKRINAPSTELGNAFFGMDKESFERTTFVTSTVLDIGATSGISARLGNFVDNTDSENSYDNALAKLEKRRKELKAARGNNDLIGRVQEEISALNYDIKNIQAVGESLTGYYAEENALKEQIAKYEEQIERANTVNLRLERREQYEKMLLRKKEYEDKLRQIAEKYPLGIPDADEQAYMKRAAEKLISLNGAMKSTDYDDYKNRRLDVLSQMFSDGVPSEANMQAVRADLNEIEKLDSKIGFIESGAEPERDAELRKKFDGKVPDDGKIERLERELERYRELDNILKAQTNVVLSGHKNANAGSRKYLIVAVLFVIVACCGIATLFFSIIIGAALIASGALGVLVFGFLHFKNRSPKASKAIVIDDGSVRKQAELQQIEGSVREFLVTYGYYSRNGILFDFEIFKKDLADYRKSTVDSVERDAQLGEYRAKCDDLSAKAAGFLSAYGLGSEDLRKSYDILKGCVDEYRLLRQDTETKKKALSALGDDMEACRKTIHEILAKYSIEPSEDLSAQLDELGDDLAESIRLKKEAENETALIEEYGQKYDLTATDDDEAVYVDEIREILRGKRNDLAVLDGAIVNSESETENLDYKLSRLEIAEEKLKAYKHRHKILTETQKFLQTAERNMKEKYISPVRDKFLYYAELIERTLGEKIVMDGDFNIMFERGGENRSDRHLSDGQRSLCALCFRLALVNNMYKDEKPFIIMDDPFVHLDAKHMDRTAKLMQSLAADNQIIYFCCHPARKVKI